jgi:hypothetical protein
MDCLRSVRAFAIMAIIAMIFAAVAPFSAMTPMVRHMELSPVAASMPGPTDCDMCPKADMALAGCAQASCQMAAVETDFSHILVTEAVRYRPATVISPAEWNTVPPVSPG